MAYVGTPIDTTNQFQSLQGKRFSGDASTTAFTLDIAPNSVFDIEVFVENVRQDPNSAYSLNGTTLTFGAAPPSGTNNIYVVHQAKAVGTISPTSDSVVASSIADEAIESEHLNNNIISGQTALAAEPADTDEFLVSDAGTIKRIDYSLIKGQTMVPAFFAYMDGNQGSISSNTATVVQFDQERFDSNSAYNTSNYLFTPAVAGKYFLFASVNIQAVHDQCTNSIIINRNAANDVAIHKVISLNSSSDREPSLAVSTIMDADTDDYFRVLVKTDFGSGTTVTGETYPTYTFFGGYRITGA